MKIMKIKKSGRPALSLLQKPVTTTEIFHDFFLGF